MNNNELHPLAKEMQGEALKNLHSDPDFKAFIGNGNSFFNSLEQIIGLKQVKITFKDNWVSDREYGMYDIVGIDLSRTVPRINLRSTESGVSMWYDWSNEYELLDFSPKKP